MNEAYYNNQQQAKKPNERKIIVAVLVLVVLVLFVGALVAVKRQTKSDLSSEGVALPSPNAPQAPVVPAPPAKRAEIRTYLVAVGGETFKEEYLDRISESAVDAYIAYKDEKDPIKKLEAARSFYVVMNMPTNFSNSGYMEMVQAIRADLDKQLGSPIF